MSFRKPKPLDEFGERRLWGDGDVLHELYLAVDEQKHNNYCNFSHLQSITSEMPPRDAVLEDGVRDELMDHVRGAA